jgi:hypothetical protein
VSISARCAQRTSCEISSPFSVQLDSSDRFSASDHPGIHGRILSEYGQMIQGLLDEKTLQLQVSCTLDAEPVSRPSRSVAQLPCTLQITLCGPLELCEEIASWFQGTKNMKYTSRTLASVAWTSNIATPIDCPRKISILALWSLKWSPRRPD